MATESVTDQVEDFEGGEEEEEEVAEERRDRPLDNSDSKSLERSKRKRGEKERGFVKAFVSKCLTS